MATRYLILENGKMFTGKAFGADLPPEGITGEVVFTTGMTGYLETLSDPSYAGQIIVQTFPLIGNYGVIPADFESDHIHAMGYIVKHACDNPSNFRCEGTLDALLREKKIPGLCGIDTRALTRILRERGVMNGVITDSADIAAELSAHYRVTGVVAASSTPSVRVSMPDKETKYHVALLDYGLKENIVRELNARGCKVTVYPQDTCAETILASRPDGIMLSNGPGDPEENVDAIAQLRILAQSGVPIFGICLGHQLMALAHGFATAKLKYGHRGGNQPAKNILTNKVYITSQNHGYAVVNDSVDKGVAEAWFVNNNDNTNEGLRYKNAPIRTVQFHPEACGGPQDTSFLFDEFMTMMEGK